MESLVAQQTGCSCSYSATLSQAVPRFHRRCDITRTRLDGRRNPHFHDSISAPRIVVAQAELYRPKTSKDGVRDRSQPLHNTKPFDTSSNIDGFTPAQFIEYSDKAEHTCRHAASIVVNASPTVCFDLWNDWCRLVDFLDLVSQIGLDPNSSNMGLFQCFYRWGMLPVLEVVFLLSKQVRPGTYATGPTILFKSVWGCPLEGRVRFIPDPDSIVTPVCTTDGYETPVSPTARTTVILELQHQLPVVLVETVNVGTFGVETHMAQILRENLADFKSLAEAVAHSPEGVPQRQTPQISDELPSFLQGYEPVPDPMRAACEALVEEEELWQEAVAEAEEAKRIKQERWKVNPYVAPTTAGDDAEEEAAAGPTVPPPPAAAAAVAANRPAARPPSAVPAAAAAAAGPAVSSTSARGQAAVQNASAAAASRGAQVPAPAGPGRTAPAASVPLVRTAAAPRTAVAPKSAAAPSAATSAPARPAPAAAAAPAAKKPASPPVAAPPPPAAAKKPAPPPVAAPPPPAAAKKRTKAAAKAPKAAAVEEEMVKSSRVRRGR